MIAPYTATLVRGDRATEFWVYKCYNNDHTNWRQKGRHFTKEQEAEAEEYFREIMEDADDYQYMTERYVF